MAVIQVRDDENSNKVVAAAMEKMRCFEEESVLVPDSGEIGIRG